MATIKLQNDKVILKDGKVSCTCCKCPSNPPPENTYIISEKLFKKLRKRPIHKITISCYQKLECFRFSLNLKSISEFDLPESSVTFRPSAPRVAFCDLNSGLERIGQTIRYREAYANNVLYFSDTTIGDAIFRLGYNLYEDNNTYYIHFTLFFFQLFRLFIGLGACGQGQPTGKNFAIDFDGINIPACVETYEECVFSPVTSRQADLNATVKIEILNV
jgi:hypothetical protein